MNSKGLAYARYSDLVACKPVVRSAYVWHLSAYAQGYDLLERRAIQLHKCSSRQMASDSFVRSRRASRPLNWTTALYAVVAPIVVVFLVVGLYRSHADLPSSVRQLSSGLTDPREAYSTLSVSENQQSTPPVPCPPCTQAATSLGDNQHTPLNLSTYSAESASSNTGLAAQALTTTTKENLPSLFLFTGVLSGRGYRHRRLAVREAWSNKAQVPGVSVTRFILSEDERTPQVAYVKLLL